MIVVLGRVDPMSRARSSLTPSDFIMSSNPVDSMHFQTPSKDVGGGECEINGVGQSCLIVMCLELAQLFFENLF